ncbi:MAG: twin-arginine translocation pathway signal protein [Planctomycetes bacterium]|nr:twin-arginine translocation pathway signal protein [Planctomycetota bacterium]
MLASGCGGAASAAPLARAGVTEGVPVESLATVTACVVRPEQTEGPFFIDERLERSDIRADPVDGALSPGLPLTLTLLLARVSAAQCLPLAGALVDIWHCDALGRYSDVDDPHAATIGHRFLRGFQTSDARGTVRFTTIFPGWYRGRTVHIHIKVRTGLGTPARREFTSQLYFADALTDHVHGQAPYAAVGRRRMRNGDDGIFRDGGEQLVLAPTTTPTGLEATFGIGMVGI